MLEIDEKVDSGNAAKERPVTSSGKWPHESCHQAVGGVDFSSSLHHLMTVVAYLAWSPADVHIYLLSSSDSFFLSLSVCVRKVHFFFHVPQNYAPIGHLSVFPTFFLLLFCLLVFLLSSIFTHCPFSSQLSSFFPALPPQECISISEVYFSFVSVGNSSWSFIGLQW